MPTDIKLDQNGGEELVFEARRVALTGALKLAPAPGDANAVHRHAEPGDLILITKDVEGALGTHFTTTELWLVVEPESPAAGPQWRQVLLGAAAASPF